MARQALLVLGVVLVVLVQGTALARETGQDTTFTLPNGATIEMVWIEPGTFMMGSPQEEIDQLNSELGIDRFSREGPQHQVTITKGFLLGKYELAQVQWESVMGTRPWAGQSYVQESPNNPAVYVSWNDAQEFIAELNSVEDADVYRLPTEAEWEYACRAGTSTRYSFGGSEGQLGQYAWYRGNARDVGENYAHAVGTKLPNPWGLYDMHGNVWEWCQDWYGSYSSGAQTDPQGPSSGAAHVVRGGSWYSRASYLRCAYRYNASPVSRNYIIGFRLCKIASEGSVVTPTTWGTIKAQF